jgi:hypothetical protein
MSERSSHERAVKYRELSLNILKIIAAAGLISTIMLLPGLAQLVPVFRVRKPCRQKQELSRLLKRLKRRGLISTSIGRDGADKIKLTAKGHKELLKYTLCEKAIDRPKRWDKKWRMVMFDIPERHRRVRENLRFFLRVVGFVKLQHSAWVYPFPCEELIELTRSGLNIRSEAIYLVCERFPHDISLVKHFELGQRKWKK